MMITRCPGCTTAFRVTPEQLKAMHGKVRCGRCQLVFDAIDNLLDAAEEAPASMAASPDLFNPEVSAPASANPDVATADLPEELPASPSLSGGSLDNRSWPSERSEPLLHQVIAPPVRHHAWAWILASALGLLLLLFQVMMHFRAELSVLSPEAKPLLLDLCQSLGCDIPLPRKVDLLSIESSDLHPGANGQLVLVTTLKNRAPFAQTYPDLELTLTDNSDQPLLRKVLAPKDYLPGNLKIAKGFVAHGEITLNLALTHDNGASATGYRLYLFYP